jgi:hypothetical protein
MKMFYWFILVVLVFVLSSGIQSQTVADGWEISAQIPVGDSLWGGWDLIVDLDLDNDGQKEFIISRDPSISGFLSDQAAGQLVEYYEASGDNQFELRWSFQAPLRNNAGRFYTSIAVGDLDGDNLKELWFGTPLDITDDPPNPKGLYVFEFDGTNFPAMPSERWNFKRPDNYLFINSGLAIGDVDSDGEEEIVIQSRGDDGDPGGGAGRTMMVVNSGGIDIGIGLGAFSIEFENSLNHIGGVVYDPRIVDFDKDGKNEIWVFTWDFFSLAIYEAQAANTYSLQVDMDQIFNPEDFGHRRGMRFYDADGDGYPEFYTAGIQPDNGPRSQVFYIDSTTDVANFTPSDVLILGGEDEPCDGSAVGDLDGDNLMDFIYVGRAGNNSEGTRVYRMEYNGSGSLSDSSSYTWSVLYESENQFADLRNLAIADLDGDSKTEVLITRANALTADEPYLIVLESITTAVDKSEPVIISQNYSLFQNYPNPFNPVTNIDFETRITGQVQISVFNIAGEKVTDLFNQYLTPGKYGVEFDGSSFTSGIYFYTLQTKGFRATRMMSLVK